MRLFATFLTIWFVDFEYIAPPGECPVPVCMVARELRTGRVIRVRQDELQRMAKPPYDIGPDSLFVAYYACAEINCHLALGWSVPTNILDLYVEFRNLTNGLHPPSGAGLLGAMAYFGLDSISVAEKGEMRQLILRGGPWTLEEWAAILAYCETDVVALAQLLPCMAPRIDLPRAILRGRYMVAAARMEHVGVPIDTATLALLRENWTAIQDRLVAEIDKMYGVYDGRSFKANRWEAWVAARGIPWPRLESGRLALDEDTFRDMSKAYPEIAPMHELRTSLSQLRLEKLDMGADGRNRTMLSAFRASTGRNQPSTARFIFGPSAWIRGLIQPEPDHGLAYVDYEQQEYGIAAALSKDPAMIAAYESGDPYLAFAVQAGAAPPGATKETHAAVREHYKQCALAVLFAMGAMSLAARLGVSVADARELLRQHHETYPRFWRWSNAAVDHAMLHNELYTVFGWRVHVTNRTKTPSLRNFPMQANGAEMLRWACCFASERGISVCAPIHDALLIEAPLRELDVVVDATRRAMGDASRLVLNGFELRTDAKIVKYPNRYEDPRGRVMWKTVMGLVGVEAEEHG